MKVLYLSLFVVILDQVTKFLVKGIRIAPLGINLPGMPYGSSKSVIGEFIKITFIENPGMAFGLDIGPKMFLTLFTIAASIIIFFYIYKHRNDGLLIRLALAFILAGAVGNLVDRTFYGEIYKYAPFFHGRVVDFIQVDVWDFTIFGKTYTTWPIFNVADVSVTLGFLIIIVFHSRIFKTHTKDTGLTGSALPASDTSENGELTGSTDAAGTSDVTGLKLQTTNSEPQALNTSPIITKSENTEKNPDSGTAGSGKD